MKVDVEGNVYCGGAGGICVMDPAGKKIGRIVHGAPATTNLAFGKFPVRPAWTVFPRRSKGVRPGRQGSPPPSRS